MYSSNHMMIFQKCDLKVPYMVIKVVSFVALHARVLKHFFPELITRDFLGAFSSLAPLSSNFPAVSTVCYLSGSSSISDAVVFSLSANLCILWLEVPLKFSGSFSIRFVVALNMFTVQHCITAPILSHHRMVVLRTAWHRIKVMIRCATVSLPTASRTLACFKHRDKFLIAG